MSHEAEGLLSSVPTVIERERIRYPPVAEHAPQHADCRVIATHAVHTSPRRRRRRTKKDLLGRRGVRIDAHHRSKKQLPEIREAAVDVASHVIRVVVLNLEGVTRAARAHDLAEAGRSALDYGFDPLGGIDR